MIVEVSRDETMIESSSSKYSTEFKWIQSHSPACQKNVLVGRMAWV